MDASSVHHKLVAPFGFVGCDPGDDFLGAHSANSFTHNPAFPEQDGVWDRSNAIVLRKSWVGVDVENNDFDIARGSALVFR